MGISVPWLALSMLSDGMNTLLLPARLAGVVGPARQATLLGLLTFGGLLAGMLLQPVAGALSDRWRPRAGRKWLLGAGVAITLLALALFGAARSLGLLAAGYLLVQLSASVAQAAQQGFIPDLVPAAERGRASGWKAMMDIGGAMVGYLLLGQLLGAGRTGTAVAVLGLALAAALGLAVVLVRERRAPAALGERASRLTLAGAFSLDLRRHRAFAWAVACRFLFLLGTYAVGHFLLYYVASRLGVSPEGAAAQAGGLLATLALATVLAAPVAGWAADRWGRVPVIRFGALVSALGVALLGTATGMGQLVAFGLLMSVGSGAFASAHWALTADLVPAEEPARFLGLANIGTAGAAATAGLFGPLIDWTNTIRPGAGYPVLFASAALVLLASAVALQRMSAAAGSTAITQEPAEASL